MWQTFTQRLRSFLTYHRRALAAVMTAVTAVVVLSFFAPPPAPTATMVVAAREVAAGSTLAAADLTTVQVPIDIAPSGAFTATEPLIGKVTTVALTPRSALGPPSVLGGLPPPPGTLHVAVRVADADLLRYLEPGGRVSVFGLSPQGEPDLLASARVVAIPKPSDDGGLVGGSRQDALVVIEVPESAAPKVANAAMQRAVSLVMGG